MSTTKDERSSTAATDFTSDEVVWLRNVPHHRIGEFLALGWAIVSDHNPGPHGFYAVLMKWTGEKDPPNERMEN